jgi:hypothetical protein
MDPVCSGDVIGYECVNEACGRLYNALGEPVDNKDELYRMRNER